MVRTPVPAVLQRRARSARLWNIAAIAVALVTAAVIVFLPLASTATDTAVSGSTAQSIESTSSTTSLFASEGMSVLIIALVPALIAAAPLATSSPFTERRLRIASTAILAVAVLLGALSIGLFFIPALLAMIFSLATSPAPTPR